MATVNKEFMAFHWQSCECLSLAESLPGEKRESFFLPVGLGCERSPLWSLTLFN